MITQMKKCLFAVLIFMMVLPALLPWMPHSSAKSLHIQQEAHHANQHKTHAHSHYHGEDHDSGSDQSMSHSFHADIITYFSDYLHVDLKNPDQAVFKAPSQSIDDIEFLLITSFAPLNRYELASVKSRAPPDWRQVRSENTPLYLSTQRLRI